MEKRFGLGLWAPAPSPAYHPAGQRGEEEEGGQGRRATGLETGPPARRAETLRLTGIRPRPADGTGIQAPRARRGSPRNQIRVSPAAFAASARDVGRRMGDLPLSFLDLSLPLLDLPLPLLDGGSDHSKLCAAWPAIKHLLFPPRLG